MNRTSAWIPISVLLFATGCGSGSGGGRSATPTLRVPTPTVQRPTATPSQAALATATPITEATEVQTAISFGSPTPTGTPTLAVAPTFTPTIASTSEQLAFFIASDFQRGSFATVSLDEPRVISPARPSRLVHQDAVVRKHDGLLYVVNRFHGDNIQVLDPGNDFATLMQCSVVPGSNPHDIAFVSATKAYVSRFGEKELYIVNPSAGSACNGFVLGSIDLSPWADDDGYPEMDQMAVIGDRLYVSLERLDRRDFLTPAETAAIVVIDVNTDAVVDEIPLTGENPFMQTKGLIVRNGALIVSQTGEFGVLDGGIERVDIASGQAQGYFITEETLGGDLTDFVLVSDELGYAIISLANFDNSLVRFNPTTGTLIDTVVSGRFFISDIELNDRGEIFAADRTATKHGVRIFRAGDGVELTPKPIGLVLPPFDIIFLP